MIKSLYRSASGMLVRQVRMDAISNNIANVNTTGFKRDNLFAKRMIDSLPVAGNLNGEHDPLADSLEMFTDPSVGSFEKTGSPFHVAINGSGFFVVNTPNGDRLTKSGAFHVNNEGSLVDANGNAVSGKGGPISIPDGQTAFITENGNVVSNGIVIGSLKVVEM